MQTLGVSYFPRNINIEALTSLIVTMIALATLLMIYMPQAVQMLVLSITGYLLLNAMSIMGSEQSFS